jgi:uncharacterized protein (UPF0261 family)
VTTPCVQAVTKQLEPDYDRLVFHATGVGGQSMEKLADSGLLAGVIDVSTTEVADEIAGGTLSAGPDAAGRVSRHALPVGGILRRAGHGELRRLGFRARTLPRPAPVPTQPQRSR